MIFESHPTGVGIGMIKTTFFVLISSLFVINRHTAHFTYQLGGFTGMLIVPALTEFILNTLNWHAAMYLYLGACYTLQ